LQCVAVCCSVLQCVAMCCSVLQFVAVCCSVLQCAIDGLADVSNFSNIGFIVIRYSTLSTGWRRPIGCLKLQVILCKRATS